MADHCFISYSTADALDFAAKLADELEGGFPYINAWFDKRDLRAGDDWDDQLVEAIKTCKVLLFILTEDSVAEGSVCKQEWSMALSYKKPVVPIRLHTNVELPFRLGSRQWIDFSNNFDAGMARLRKHIAWLDGPEGRLRILKDRFADAERDLRRASPEQETRIRSEIKDLKSEIEQQAFIVKNPKQAEKQTRKNIDIGLERDRKSVNSVGGKPSSKFINPLPGSIPDYFEGRFIETQEITDFLRNDYQRIMTVIGRAGGGKTVLVCRVLQSLEFGQFPNELGEFNVGGIIYLSEISSYRVNVANIFSGLLQLINREQAAQLEELYKEAKVSTDIKVRAMLKALPNETVVLLLDNFETLLTRDGLSIKDEELEDALKTILFVEDHGFKVIITTRVPPRGLTQIEPSKHYVLHLEEGLVYPYAENVLRKLDKDGRAGFRDASEELLGRVREATLGYPRAMESLYSIVCVDRYADIEALLIKGLPDTVVEKLVGEAFVRLDAVSQKVMEALAVYNHPVSSAAIDYLLQFHIPGINSSPILDRLVSMHFARREAWRYFLHPVDRDFAWHQIPQGDTNQKLGQGARARTWTQFSLMLRAADYFREARKPRVEWRKLDDLAAQLVEFDLRCATNDFDTAASILIEIDIDCLHLWGHYRMMIDLHEKLQGKINNEDLAMISLGNLGTAYYSIGKVIEAIRYHEKVLEMARERKNRQAESAALGNMGNNYYSLGEIAKSIEFYEQALSIAREMRNRKHEGNALGSLANSYADLGEMSKALEYYEKALEIAQKIGDRRIESVSLDNLGNVFSVLGKVHKAIKFHEQSLLIARETGNRTVEGTSLNNLGYSYDYILGETQKGIEHYEKALFIQGEIGKSSEECVDLANYGFALINLNSFPEAIEKFISAISIADRIKKPQIQAYARWGLAQVYLLQNDLTAAHASIEAALHFDVPKINHNITNLYGIITLRQEDGLVAYHAFTRTIVQSDEILVKTSEYFEALDAKGLALAGLTICDFRLKIEEPGKDKLLSEAMDTFKKARKIAPHAGIVKRVLRLFDELAKCDSEGLLAGVREAVEGK